MMLSLTRSYLTRRCSAGVLYSAATTVSSSRTYVTRAHPAPALEFPAPDAVESVLEEVQSRRLIRQRKAARLVAAANKKEDADADADSSEGDESATSTTTTTTTSTKPPRKIRHPDETIELALNLNLDPRKPGQALRGSVSLPHGTGQKGVNCVVFTNDAEAQEASIKAGALHAGGEALIDQIVAGEIPVDTFQTALATSDMMQMLTKKAARLLGPRGLMPNVKVGTLLKTTEELLEAVDTQLAGKEVSYRTEKEGIVHVAVGKQSFGPEKLLDNIGAVMKAVFDAKPDNYGKGKKKKSNTKKGQAKSTKQPKYLLKASVSSTQGPGIRVDLRTVDPTSAFFLTGVDPLLANSAKADAENPQPQVSETVTPAAA